MRKLKKFLIVMICLLLAAAPVVSVSAPVSVQAAATQKTQLKKIKGNYYAYEKGKKICNKWRTIKVGKNSYRYYFGKTGAAYKADTANYGKHGVLVKKIGSSYYGFDYLGHMVTGLRGGKTSMYGAPQVYYFNSKGVYDKARTAKYRKASKMNAKAATIKKLLGKYQKRTTSSPSCFLDGNGVDVTYTYAHLELNVFRPKGKSSSAEIVESLMFRYN